LVKDNGFSAPDDDLNGSNLSNILTIGSCDQIAEIQNLKIMTIHSGKKAKDQPKECQECAKILIIDDDNFNILAIELLLTSLGRPNIA